MAPLHSTPLHIGPIRIANAVMLAPMSGVTDLPFRKLARDLGAGLVVSEMIASEELVRSRRDMLRKAVGETLDPFVIQLAGRDPGACRLGASSEWTGGPRSCGGVAPEGALHFARTGPGQSGSTRRAPILSGAGSGGGVG